MKYRYTVLTKREREMVIHSLFSEKNLVKDFSLTEIEIKKIRKINKPYISLGYAVQLLFLKNRGISILSSYELITEKIIKYIALQIVFCYTKVETVRAPASIFEILPVMLLKGMFWYYL